MIRPQHSNQHDMLASQVLDRSFETFRQKCVIERGKKNNQGSPPKMQAEERGDFVEIRRGEAGREVVDGIAAGRVVSLPRFRTDERLHFRRKGRHTEEVSM